MKVSFEGLTINERWRAKLRVSVRLPLESVTVNSKLLPKLLQGKEGTATTLCVKDALHKIYIHVGGARRLWPAMAGNGGGGHMNGWSA